MGKSYKKHRAVSETTNTGSKKLANRRVRRLLKNTEENFNYKAYKKAYDSWEIKDYKEVAPSFEIFFENQIARWNHMRTLIGNKAGKAPTREECLKLYRRWYIRK